MEEPPHGDECDFVLGAIEDRELQARGWENIRGLMAQTPQDLRHLEENTDPLATLVSGRPNIIEAGRASRLFSHIDCPLVSGARKPRTGMGVIFNGIEIILNRCGLGRGGMGAWSRSLILTVHSCLSERIKSILLMHAICAIERYKRIWPIG
ncbi:MAG TPA: hypothetical protein VHA10_08050 [Hypericibacter adhaerens]|uniref:Uncharacterized protein n=1 Tax=Hypericibacter adhaerens TaxID=2602016 RepID=A0A5J6N0W7_9PROT|nr:hypothetical protein [Hypericibacter adhaerens]QEX22904.1 hypothetical protein FRZ61_28380 [Hypericibacter adhaerens]HWA43148.1 hypothetical protein [Hypericibacter adhaerens]